MIRWWASLLALALAGCGREPAVSARPAMWEVRDADTTVWLLGTVHALPSNVAWRTPAVRAAIARADALALELPDDPAATQAAFEAASRADGLPSLTDRLPAAWRPALAAAMARAGVAAGTLDRRKTWGAAAILGSAAAARDGAEAASGVERMLAAEFRAAGKPRLGLETTREQFAAFDTLPERAQLALLGDTIRGVLGHPTYRETMGMWARGDVPALATAVRDGLTGPPVLAEQLLDRRNARFAAAVAARMARPGTLLVAVGAGHLAGADSVVALLMRRGFAIRRVE